MKKKRHRLLAFMILVVVVSGVVTCYGGQSEISAAKVQAGIAKQIIRFHVRANSDSDADQQLKLKVKDAVVTYLQPLLSASESTQMSRQILEDHMEEIRSLALEVLADNGSDYGVKVYFEESYFPMKSYGDVTFPPGVYEAFRIDIGESDGKNWWCVLYPPLCFVDAAYGVLPDESKDTLKNILTDDEYNAITKTQCQYRFKVLTFLNDWIDSITGK